MLVEGDYGPNLVLGYDDSLQNVITRTMLNQEEIFRKQVLELHRLYRIQKILMKELDMTVTGERSFSFVGPLSEQLKFDSLATKRKMGEVDMLDSSKSMKNHFQQEHRGSSKHQHRPLDLELSSRHYTHGNADPESESSGCINKMRYNINENIMFSVEDLSLSLTAVSEDKIIWSHPPKDIFLLQSTDGGLISKPACRFGVHANDSEAKHEFESNCTVRSFPYDASDRISEPPSPTDGRLKFLQRENLNQEVEQSWKSTSAKRRLFTEKEFDLNKALPDESSAHSVHHCISNSSKVHSSDVSDNGGGENGKHNFLVVLHQSNETSNGSNEPSSTGQQDVAVSTSTGEHISGSIPSKTSPKMSMPKTKSEEHKEDKLCSNDTPQELFEATGSNRSPASCKSDWIMEDVSSNTKPVPNSNISLYEFQNSDSYLVEQNAEPYVEMKPMSADQKKEELAKVDIEVRKGAVSLIYFSLGCLSLSTSRNQDYVQVSEKREGRYNIEREVPQSSCESYELLVLKQPECNADEYCVSSTPLEISGCNEKDAGIKVRRGRRMKDFRKEILPSLASLSKQEIYEDEKIMELAIRSREYQKFNSKNNKNLVYPSKRRRNSRSQGVGRRYYY